MDLGNVKERIAKPERTGSEWNAIAEYFFAELAPSWDAKKGKGPLTLGRVRGKLKGLKTADLRYMQSVFKDTQRRRGTVAAAKEFYWSLNPSKHDNN